MAGAFFLSWLGWLRLGIWLLGAIPAAGSGAIARRTVMFVLGWPLFGLLNLVNWLGFLLDEVFFPEYRRVDITGPVFILGIPRSGTTFLHRVLAEDQQFTTLTLVECLFAPSITQRYVLHWLSKLPFSLRGPGIGSRMDDIHVIRAGEPEEDFLLLLTVQACFLGVVPCPDASHFWRLGRFDTSMPRTFRTRVMQFYRRCLQKHLFYHGPDRRLLSKNPSFTPMISSLKETFPDASFVACERAPRETIASQLSSLLPALELLGMRQFPERFRDRMIALLHHYYERLRDDNTLMKVSMARLNASLETVVQEIYDGAGLQPSENFRERLTAFGADGREYKSGHRYALADFDLHAETIEQQFADVWQGASPGEIRHDP